MTSPSQDNQVHVPRASEAAEAFAVVAGSMDDLAARRLMALLGHALSAPTNALLLHTRLGLLVELIDDTAEVPKSHQYDRLRRARAERGESWPDRTELADAYGSWIKAVRAAMRYVFTSGLGSGVGHSQEHLRVATNDYSRHEVLDAIVSCREWLGPWAQPTDWPTSGEYFEWATLRRRAAWSRRDRATGRPVDVRLPGKKAVMRWFATYEDAVAAAIRERGPR